MKDFATTMTSWGSGVGQALAERGGTAWKRLVRRWGRRRSPTTAAQGRWFSGMRLPMLIVDRHSRVLALNEGFTRDSGYLATDLVGTALQGLLSADQDTDDYEHLWRTAQAEGQWQGPVRLRRLDGSSYPAWMTLSAVPGPETGPAPGRFFVALSDISAIRHREDRWRHLAFHDSLTGLPNRRLFARDLARAIDRALRHGRGFALLLVDLDHFRQVNERLGHAGGDQVLADVAERLRRCVRAGDAIARFEGDEFMLLLEEMDNRDDAARAARHVLAAIDTAMEIEGQPVSLSASIGVAMFPGGGVDAAGMIQAADEAAARAKLAGRNTYAFNRPLAAPTPAAQTWRPAASEG